MKAERTLILSLSAIALVACTQPSASAPTQAPTLPTSAPTSAPTPARAEPTATPPPAASALPGGDLSDADMTKILQASIAAYPWRIKRSTTIKLYAQQTNGLVEAQSSTRVHMVTQGDTRGRMFTLESIFITPTLYMKATGAPPELLQEAGAQEGKWLKVPEDNRSYLAGLAKLAYLGGDPTMGLLGILNQIKQSSPNQKPFKLVGTESVGNALRNVYELKVGSGDLAITYRASVGSSDGRIYKWVSDSAPRTMTMTFEYDPSINIQPPIP